MAMPAPSLSPSTAAAPQPRPTIFRFWSALFVVVLAAEYAARRPLVTRSFDLAAQRSEWGNSHSPPDYLILGDSTAHRLNGEEFAIGAHGKVLNLALSSCSPIVMRRLVNGLTWRSHTVVVGLSPFILSDGWPSALHEVEVATWRETLQLLGVSHGVLTRLSAVYRYRTWFQQWLHLHPPPTSGTWPLDEDKTGSLPVDQPALTAEVGAKDAARLWKMWDASRPRTGSRYRALTTLAAQWKREGYQVVYVLMPVSSALRQLGHTDPMWNFQRTLLQHVIGEYGGRLLDCRSAVADEGFYDADHMRRSPARDAFSRELGRLVLENATECTRI